MKLGSALKTKTSKTVIAGTLLATVMSLGVTGTASADRYSGNNWRNKDYDKHQDRNTCEDSFWVYNKHDKRWFRVGYNDRTDRWEVCRRNYNDNYNWNNNHNNYDDRNWDRDENYWDHKGRHENDNNRYSNYGRRDY